MVMGDFFGVSCICFDIYTHPFVPSLHRLYSLFNTYFLLFYAASDRSARSVLTCGIFTAVARASLSWAYIYRFRREKQCFPVFYIRLPFPHYDINTLSSTTPGINSRHCRSAASYKVWYGTISPPTHYLPNHVIRYQFPLRAYAHI